MDELTAWLLEGDPAIRYLTYRDLLCASAEQLRSLQALAAREGICARLLACRNEDGHWGIHYYQPKWTSTHYTLLSLKDLGLAPLAPACRDIVRRMFGECQMPGGGMNLSKHDHPGDVCVDGMVLSYASYFCPEDTRLDALARCLAAAQKPDGGYAWDAHAERSDPHTTICVLEGLAQFAKSRGTDRASVGEEAMRGGVAYLLANDLFVNSADPRFAKLTYPSRYRYDLLRALEFFARQKILPDARMLPALKWLRAKRRPDGRWPLEYTHPGNVFFPLEEKGHPSRFITQKALFVDSYFPRDDSLS